VGPRRLEAIVLSIIGNLAPGGRSFRLVPRQPRLGRAFLDAIQATSPRLSPQLGRSLRQFHGRLVGGLGSEMTCCTPGHTAGHSPGYVWLEVPGKVQHVPEHDLRVHGRTASCDG
jgi:hypothetical protein